DHLIASDGAFERYHERLASSPVIDLSKGYDAYIATRQQKSKSLVSSVRRKARRLARAHGELRFELETRDPAMLNRLFGWKSAQYARSAARDVLRDAWLVGVLEDLLHRPRRGCRGMLSMLWSGERPVAGIFSLVSDSVASSWFPAYDIEF